MRLRSRILVRRVSAKRQRGFLTTEVLIAIAFLTLLTVEFVQMLSDTAITRQERVTAERLQEVIEATQAYSESEFSNLLSAAPAAVPIVGPGAPAGLSNVQEAGFLPDSFNQENPFGQREWMIVRNVNPGQLDVLIVTAGGREIPPTSLGSIASQVGPEAGLISDITPYDPTRIYGAFGGWESPVANWTGYGVALTAGHITASLGLNDGNIIRDYLYRVAVPGFPEANEMQTNLYLGNNDINDVNDLQVNRDADFGRDVTIGQDLDVAQDGSVGGDLGVTGNTSVDGNVTIGVAGSGTGDLTVERDGYIRNNFEVENNAFVNGTLVVGSYLETTTGWQNIAGGTNIPDNTQGNVWRYQTQGNVNLRLPFYVNACPSSDPSCDTTNSLTVIVDQRTNHTISWSTQDAANVEWSGGQAEVDVPNCFGASPAGRYQVMYQFVRFSGASEWLGQSVYQECEQ